MHRGSDEVQLHRHQRIEVVVEWIPERRGKNHRPNRSGLVMVIHDLRIPCSEQNAVHRLRFGLRRHVRVTVVVVAGVLVIKPRQPGSRTPESVRVAHVPVGHKVLPVRIRGHQQNDVVAKKPHRLRIVLAHQLVRHENELLCPQHLAGVEPTVDPHYSLPFRREGPRLRIT